MRTAISAEAMGSDGLLLSEVSADAATREPLQQALRNQAGARVVLDLSRLANPQHSSVSSLATSLISLHQNGLRVFVQGVAEEVRRALLHFGVIAAADGSVAFLLEEELPFAD